MKARNLGKHYTARFKFQVVLEVLKAEKTMGQLAKAYGVHPVTLSHWKGEFLDKGPEVFGQRGTMEHYEQRLRELERLIGQKEVELALLKNFLGGPSPSKKRSN